MSELRVVSLFSGIGGFEEGLRLANIPHRVVFASEIDKFAQQSYGANFDSSVLIGDITQVNERETYQTMSYWLVVSLVKRFRLQVNEKGLRILGVRYSLMSCVS